MNDSVIAPRVPCTDWEIRDDVLIGEELGSGCYSRVFEGEWKGDRVAVKVIHVHAMFVEVGLPRNDVLAFLRSFEAEWEAMKSLRHPNVLQLFGVCNPKAKQPKMILELMDKSLRDRLQEGPTLSSLQKNYVLKSIACGLKYLHELPCPVVHRNLGSKNIFLSQDAVQVKLGDLGVMTVFTELCTGRGTVMPGTELYMPPEAHSEVQPNPSLDIFSFGVIMIETIIGQSPSPLPLLTQDPTIPVNFRVLTELERRERDVQKVPEDYSLRSVIILALDLPERRPSAAQVLDALSDCEEKMICNENANAFSELQACKQKVLQLEANKEMLESQNRELTTTVASLKNEIEQLICEVATLKTNNVQLSLEVVELSMSNVDCHSVDQPDARELPTDTCRPPSPVSLPSVLTQLPFVAPSNQVPAKPMHMVRSERVSIDGNLIAYCETPEDSVGGFLSLDHRIDDNFTYFELQIINCGEHGRIGIGLARQDYPLNLQPGWDHGSVGYCCNDGRLFYGSRLGYPFSEPSQQGDILGCGIKRVVQSRHNQREATVFFTRNGIMMGRKMVMIPDDGFYPMVALNSQGETIKANFSGTPCFGMAETSDPTLQLESKLLMRYQHVALNGDKVSFTKNTRNDVGVYQVLSHPMDMDFSYFEVQIVSYDSRGTIVVGLAGIDHPLHRHPGYENGSIAFHCSNGKVYKESSEGQHTPEPAKKGDIIGCGISKFTELTELQVVVFFTINRALLGEATITVPQGGLYPTIGMHSVGEMVQLDLNAVPLEASDQSQVVAIPLEFNVPPNDSNAVLLSIPPPYFTLFPPVNSRYGGVRVDGCRVTYTGSLNNDVGMFQSLGHRIGNNFTYYQVQVVSHGFTGMISIGLAHDVYPLNRHPGWDRGSIGYHCDDGRLFYENGHGQCIHAAAQQGDIVGCGVSKVISSNPCKAIVFFTHNDMKLGDVTVPVPDGGFYPTVGMSSLGGVIDISFESSWSDTSCHQGDSSVRHELVYVEGDKVSYVGNQANAVGVFQLCGRPINHSFPYYEVTVMNYGSRGTIAVGLAGSDYPLNSQPGWNVGSVAYHCDDGELYVESEHGQSFYVPSRQGDIIGCGILSFQESDQEATVFVTHNDTKIGEVTVAVPHRGFFPTIGLHSAGEVVKVDVNVIWDDTDGSWSLALASDRYDNVQVTDNTIQYVENWRNEVGVFQAITQPMTPRLPYFEVHIVEVREQCTVGVGIARKSYPLNMQPGWCRGSVAYHCDDGKLFQESGSSDHFFGAASKGDVIGCGIRLASQQAVVFFTRNGMKLAETTVSLPSGGFYPTVGLHSRGEVVRINFAAQWIENGVHCERVQVNGDKISFNGMDQIGCFQDLRKSMDRVGRYFEVEIVNCGTHGYIGIGLAYPGYSLNRMPGWEPGSVAYHCDNGQLYEAKRGGRAFHSPSRSRDVIGCGVSKIIKLDPRMMEIFFTKNGVMMGQAAVVAPTEGFFPTVGFYSEAGTVRINLRAMGPVYAPISGFVSEGIQTQGNRLVYAGNRTARIGCYQLASRPLDSQFSYFEMTVVSAGANGASSIGVTHKGYPLNSMPGREKDSVSFHGDDGQLFCGIGQGQPLHSPANEGDVIGCGLSLSHAKPRIFFTSNGTKIGEVIVNVPDEGFYPTIWMYSEGEAVHVNFSVMWCEDHGDQLQPHLKLHLERVSRDGDKVSYVGDPQTSVGGVQVLSHPITPNFNQYKVQIINAGKHSSISVGLANQGYPLNNQPGWLPGSVAYHCGDGKLYTGSGKGQRFHSSSKAGDIIGCSVNFSSSDPRGKWVAVVFTRNSVIMGKTRVTLALGQTYPTVGMHSEGEIVKLIM